MKLAGNNDHNSLPEAKSDTDLAEEFAQFFLNKIEILTEQFKSSQTYHTNKKDVPKLEFYNYVRDQAIQAHYGDANKSCEIDTIPTKLLRKVLKYGMLTLTKIINLSLKTGILHDGWKPAIIKPLIKSLTKERVQ